MLNFSQIITSVYASTCSNILNIHVIFIHLFIKQLVFHEGKIILSRFNYVSLVQILLLAMTCISEANNYFLHLYVTFYIKCIIGSKKQSNARDRLRHKINALFMLILLALQQGILILSIQLFHRATRRADMPSPRSVTSKIIISNVEHRHTYIHNTRAQANYRYTNNFILLVETSRCDDRPRTHGAIHTCQFDAYYSRKYINLRTRLQTKWLQLFAQIIILVCGNEGKAQIFYSDNIFICIFYL